MVDEKKVFLHNVKMVKHADGAAQYLEALLGGRFVTREQTRDMIDYLFVGTKKKIDSCSFVTQEQKGAEIHRREIMFHALKPVIL